MSISHADLVRETWPGDFNEDGITDLIGVQRDAGNLIVQMGRSNATVVTDLRAIPIYVADFNRDGLADVVAKADDGGALYVLRGHGDGTFETAATFADGLYTFALAVDFDGDGQRDLAVGEEPDSLHLFRGFGDFTFAPAVSYVTGAWPHGGIMADFNGDRLLDIAIASRYSWQITLLTNGGNLLFTTTTLDSKRSTTDAAARDLDRDGDVDLVVSGRGDAPDGPYVDGYVAVYRNRGDGTFDESVSYRTAPGAHAVVLGDFTRDGIADVATANQSAQYVDHMCGGPTGVDSVSVLQGNDDGTFRPHTSFALSPQRSWDEGSLQNVVESLNTSDVNGDGHTDLITSHGVVLLNVRPQANRQPVASAGADQESTSEDVLLFGGGVDRDHHLLSFSWVHSGGKPIPPVAITCASGLAVRLHRFQLTVSDGQGGVDRDTMRFVRVAEPEPTAAVVRPK